MCKFGSYDKHDAENTSLLLSILCVASALIFAVEKT